MLWAMFSWDTLGLIIQIAQFLTSVRYLTKRTHSWQLFPSRDGNYLLDNVPCHTVRIQKWLEEHDSEFLLMPWPSNLPNQTFVVRLGKVG